VADQRERAAVLCGERARLAQRLRQRVGGIGMRAVTEHDVEQQRRGGRVLRVREQRGVALRRVDHRMRAPARVLVVAQVDEHVPLRPRADRPRAVDRRVRRDREAAPGERELRLVAERPAAEQAAHVARRRRHRRRRGDARRGGGRRCPAEGAAVHGGVGRVRSEAARTPLPHAGRCAENERRRPARRRRGSPRSRATAARSARSRACGCLLRAQPAPAAS
jgi:hypothetical protein